jgi:hypothetical protein
MTFALSVMAGVRKELPSKEEGGGGGEGEGIWIGIGPKQTETLAEGSVQTLQRSWRQPSGQRIWRPTAMGADRADQRPDRSVGQRS